MLSRCRRPSTAGSVRCVTGLTAVDASDGRRLTRDAGVRENSIRYRELFEKPFRRDLRAKYKGSVLGLAWTLAFPSF